MSTNELHTHTAPVVVCLNKPRQWAITGGRGWRGHEQHVCDAACIESPTTLLGRGEVDLHVPAQQDTNEGERRHNMSVSMG